MLKYTCAICNKDNKADWSISAAAASESSSATSDLLNFFEDITNREKNDAIWELFKK